MTPEEKNQRFAGLLKLTTEESDQKAAPNEAQSPSNDANATEPSAQPSTPPTETVIPAQNAAITASGAPTRAKKPKRSSKAAKTPDGPPERLFVDLRPKSQVYEAVVDAREAFPAGLRSTSLSKVLIMFLSDNDEQLSKMIRKHFEV